MNFNEEIEEVLNLIKKSPFLIDDSSDLRDAVENAYCRSYSDAAWADVYRIVSRVMEQQWQHEDLPELLECGFYED